MGKGPWDGKYNGDQMLAGCKISPFDLGPHQRLDRLVTQIMATIVTEKDPLRLTESLRSLLFDSCSVSIGAALDKLHSVATTGPEFDHDRDGLDALCYHLSKDRANRGIADLQAILGRFAQLDAQ